MKYTIDKQEKYAVLRLHEDKLNSSIAPQLKTEIVTLQTEGFHNLILDMSEIKYTDSSGLSALLVGNRILQESGGICILTKLSEHSMKLIKISQLDSVLHILPTVEEGINAVFLHQVEHDIKKKE